MCEARIINEYNHSASSWEKFDIDLRPQVQYTEYSTVRPEREEYARLYLLTRKFQQTWPLGMVPLYKIILDAFDAQSGCKVRNADVVTAGRKLVLRAARLNAPWWTRSDDVVS
jgi:hypothetical protein